MPEPKIRRKFRALPVTLTTAESTATPLRWDDVAGGTLLLGTVSTNATSVQVWAAESLSGNYARLHDSGGAAADVTLAPSTSIRTAYALPDACYGAGGLKLVAGQAAGTNTTATVLVKT